MLRRSTRHGAKNLSARPHPKAKTSGGVRPTAKIGQCSGARSLLTPSSCPEMLPPPRGPCRASLANSLPTESREQLRRPESHRHHRNPKRRADARRPPCGGLPTPELARSTKHWTPDRARGSRMTTADVAAGRDRSETRPTTIGGAQPRTAPPSSFRGQKTPDIGRRMHPERRQRLPTGLR